LSKAAEADIRWFEEPVTSDDVRGLRVLREHCSDYTDVAAGEYTYTLDDARRLLEAGAVDVLQADVTRCGGITGFLQVGALCEAHCLSLSAHCAPSASTHPCLATMPLWPMEYFHDHHRIETMLFDGAQTPKKGSLWPDLSRPGMGLEFKHADAERYLVWKS